MKMLFNQGVRLFHMAVTSMCKTAPASKSQLAKLRKKTGYTFSNCKKALQMHNNDLDKAERWLFDQAQALGWSKATKLDGRPTAQGLIAVVVDRDSAAIIEVNCETDFVARNDNFHGIVQKAVRACIHLANSQSAMPPFTKLFMENEQLRELPSVEGTRLCDELALVIGTVGENLSLRRAACFRAASGIRLAGYAHPSQNTANNTFFGKYGALIAFKESGAALEGVSIDQVSRDLCQHIVGMSPTKVGVQGEDEPCSNPDDEQCLIHQEYLLDPTQTVSQLMSDTGITILDFIRFECGEILEAQQTKEPTLEINEVKN